MKNIIISLFTLFLFGCNQELIVENDLPYNEKLVVQGIIRSESSIVIDVSKTEPVNKPASAFTKIEDAKVYLKHQGVTDTLTYAGNGQYTNCNYTSRTGINYDLFVNWNGKSCTGSTSIPPVAKLLSSSLHQASMKGDDTISYITCNVTPEKGYIYGAVYMIIDGFHDYYFEDTLIAQLKREGDKNEKGVLEIRTRAIPSQVLHDWKYFFNVKVYAYDEQIYKYYLTQNANLGGNNIFSSVGTNLRWNITGDGIGLFIGYSSTGVFKVDP